MSVVRSGQKILVVKMWSQALFRHKKDPFLEGEKSLETYIY